MLAINIFPDNMPTADYRLQPAGVANPITDFGLPDHAHTIIEYILEGGDRRYSEG
jgi:hypothetical protein